MTEGQATRLPAGDLRPSTIAILFLWVMAAVSVPVLTHPLLPLTDYSTRSRARM